MLCVETWPRSSPGRIPASAAAWSIELSERAIVPTVDGFADGPCSRVLPMMLYGAPTYTVALACHTCLPPSEIR